MNNNHDIIEIFYRTSFYRTSKNDGIMIERYFKRSRRLWHEQKKWKLNRVIRSGISKLFESVKKLYGHYVRQLLMVQRNVRRMPQTCPRVLKLRMVRDILCSRILNKKDVPHMVIQKESNPWPNSKTNKSDQTYSKFIILFKNGRHVRYCPGGQIERVS